jgi:hypothetical protein
MVEGGYGKHPHTVRDKSYSHAPPREIDKQDHYDRQMNQYEGNAPEPLNLFLSFDWIFKGFRGWQDPP